MATKIGIAKIKDTDSFKAGVEAARLALKRAGLEKCDFVFVFATIGHNQEELLKGVRSITKHTPLIGCSVGGLITREGADEDLRTIGVMVIGSDEMKFTPAVAKGLRQDSLQAGKEIARQLNKNWPKDARLLIPLPDGLTVNPDRLFRGLEENLNKSVPFVGGTAGETLAFKQTYQYFKDQVLEDSVACVLVSGKFGFETGVSHGSLPAGLEKTVTKAEGNHIYEVDNSPAFNVFKEYLGDDIADLHGVVVSGVCLGVAVPEKARGQYEDVILRIPLRLDQKDGSLYMAAEWPVGTKILICERDPKRVIQKTRETSEKVRQKIGGSTPKFVLQFNCLGRGKDIMGKAMAEEEIKASQEPLGRNIPWLGWYSFGEIAPIGKKNYFHNWAGVLLVVY